MNDNASPSATNWNFATIKGENGRWVAIGMRLDGQSTVSSSHSEDDALKRCKKTADELSAREEG